MQLDFKPEDWRQHRFGLSAKRWAFLSGKSFWVTGAGTGYGRCISLSLAAAEGRVYLTGRREAKLRETVEQAARFGIDARLLVPLTADITSPEEVSRAAEQIASQGDRPLFGLVNNAALPQGRKYRFPLLDSSWDEWRAWMRTNVDAQWFVAQRAIREMSKGESGRIIFMSSEAGWASTPGFGIYNTSKAALNSLAASFAAEREVAFPGKDIQINTLVPGEARTEMNQGSQESPYKVVTMALALLSSPPGGPNGRFFHRDGRSVDFAYSKAYAETLFEEGDSSPRKGLRSAIRW
jgi:NAD(P)-dependent dehydrogenase (short-subunit alcohol dehydrogenase family)